MPSESFQLSKVDVLKTIRTAGISALATFLSIVSSYLAGLTLDLKSMVLVSLLVTFIDLLRRYLTDYSLQEKELL